MVETRSSRRVPKALKEEATEAATAAPPVSPHQQSGHYQSPPSHSAFHAITLVAGIYTCFIFWGYMQERVTTTTYVTGRETWQMEVHGDIEQ